MAQDDIFTGKLDPGAIIEPLFRAVQDSFETIEFSLSALESADLSAHPLILGGFVHISTGVIIRDAADRKKAYGKWLLRKGFQEAARGARQMLEEALVYTELVARGGSRILLSDVRAARGKAGRMDMKKLVSTLDKRLLKPLAFAYQFRSLYHARNCLEHRAGVVGLDDLNGDGKLQLVLPLTLVYMVDGKEVELDQEVPQGTQLHIQTQIQEFSVGEEVIFTRDQFHRIAFACQVLAQDLRSKLPPPPT